MTRTLSLAGGRHELSLDERGDGEPILVLHGLLGWSDDEPLLDLLARDFRVIAPHMPNYAGSTGLEHIDEPQDITLLLQELLDKLGIDSAHVVGHSLGGMYAAELACAAPGRVRSLALVAPLGLWLDDKPIPDHFILPLEEQAKLFFADAGSAIARKTVDLPDDLEEAGEVYLERMRRATAATKVMWPIPDRGLSKRLYRLSSPTALIWGKDDGFVDPGYAKAFAVHLGPSNEIVMEGGHMLTLEQPEKLAASLSDHIGAAS